MKSSSKFIATNSLLLLILLMISNCKENTNDHFKADWLIGSWLQNNDSLITHEIWKENGQQFSGHGFIVFKGDTVWEERMKIHLLDTTWTLTVTTPSNNDQVSFQIKSWTDSSFIATNFLHDFPKRIEYYFDGKLNANVSGDKKLLEYRFLKEG